MPVYLFTLHTYGSWLPDRARGYVKRKQGVLEPDAQMAGWYREAMDSSVVEWTPAQQRSVIAAVRKHCTIKAWTAYAIATDPTHVHALIAWRDRTPWMTVRRGLKASISRALNEHSDRRKWLSEGGSRKRVTDQDHFDYLRKVYLPSHRGGCWDTGQATHAKDQLK
ncbi:MAG: hypothetical protein AAF078_00455 [Planctomycetota bacterium]